LNKIKDVPSPRGFGQTFASAQKSELLANKRYPVYERGVDLENIYGLQQSWYDQLGNGVAKLGANIVGTFAQSLTNIPNTVSAIKAGDFAKLSGDPEGYEGTIDNWMRNMDDVFPNYMTQYERDHPYITAIPFTRGSANWWGGKFLPNIGFMVGAVAGAAVTDIAVGAVTQGIGEIPLVAAQLGKASLALNRLFTSVTQLKRVLSLGKQLGKTEEEQFNAWKDGLHRSLRSASVELYVILVASLILAGAKGDYDDDEKADYKQHRFGRFMVRTLGKAHKEMLGLLDPTEYARFLQEPLPIAGMLRDLINVFTNTNDEFLDWITNNTDKRDKTPWGYYSSYFIPGFRQFRRIVEPYEQDKEVGLQD
jgi:hypothetical protein